MTHKTPTDCVYYLKAPKTLSRSREVKSEVKTHWSAMEPPETERNSGKGVQVNVFQFFSFRFWFGLTSGRQARRRLLPTTRSNLFKPPVQVTRTVRTTVCNVAGNHQRLTGVESTREETLQ